MMGGFIWLLKKKRKDVGGDMEKGSRVIPCKRTPNNWNNKEKNYHSFKRINLSHQIYGDIWSKCWEVNTLPTSDSQGSFVVETCQTIITAPMVGMRRGWNFCFCSEQKSSVYKSGFHLTLHGERCPSKIGKRETGNRDSWHSCI